MGQLFRSATILFAVSAASAAPFAPRSEPLRLERVVLLMRHGVRPPTKEPAMPIGTARDPWPSWPVAPGYLTPHGAAGVRLLGLADRAWLSEAGLLPQADCPDAGAVSVHSDSDQRTIATGDAYLGGLVTGCGIANRHEAQGHPDPLFATAGEGDLPFDPARANRAVAESLGSKGIAGVEADHRDVLARLDRILCGSTVASCGVAASSTTIVPAGPGKRPKLAGALDRGSTAAQILLLEYAEGKPMTDVGWGRVTPADITALSALHSTEFALLARPPYLAARNSEPIARAIAAALADAASNAPRLTVIVGHDTNVASFGGLLGVHWQVPGYARDDPPPGGAIIFELLRDMQGRRLVRASFRAQTLDALRGLVSSNGRTSRIAMTIAGCAALCPSDRFQALIDARLGIR